MTALALRVESGTLEAAKWVALFCMVVDHVNAVFFAREAGPVADMLGRLAFPLFALVIGYNFARPGIDLQRVAVRLVVLAVLSAGPYAYLFGIDGGWWPLNVMATFLVAVGVIAALQADRPWLAGYAFLVGGALVEFYWAGVGLVVATWMMASARRPQVFRPSVGLALVLVCAVNGNLWALLAVPVAWLLWRAAPEVPRLRWVFYAFYPAHLLVLAMVKSAGG